MKTTLILTITTLALSTSLYSQDLGFRKYSHVKSFYKQIATDTIAIAKKNDLPAAAILAIAGLESGYGSGYVAQITGNILSLGAFKGDAELPALYLPYSKSKKQVLFDPNIINKLPKSDLVYKKRAKSYKRDYRPSPYAGTHNQLELLKYDDSLKNKAHYMCINDFATRWITLKSNIPAFRNAKKWLLSLTSKNKEILFSMNSNQGFIERIGGVPHSFNYRKTWPKKVELIMKKTRLIDLVDDMANKHMSFEEAWRD